MPSTGDGNRDHKTFSAVRIYLDSHLFKLGNLLLYTLCYSNLYSNCESQLFMGLKAELELIQDRQDQCDKKGCLKSRRSNYSGGDLYKFNFKAPQDGRSLNGATS